MINQKKVKTLLSLAIIIIVSLFVVVAFQLVNISKMSNALNSKKDQIQQLQQQLDYYQNKTPQSDYEEIT